MVDREPSRKSPEVDISIPHWGTTQPLRYDELKPTLYDVHRRPISEELKDNIYNVPFDKKTVIFPDSRKGIESNESAYQSVMQEYKLALGIFSVIRNSIVPYELRKPTHDEFLHMTTTALMLPFWQVLRADNPVQNGEIASEVSSLAKIARGLTVPFNEGKLQKVYDRFNKITTFIDTSFFDSSRELYDKVDRDKLLIRIDDTFACPASPNIILDAGKVLIEQPAEAFAEAKAFLDESGVDLNRLKRYGEASNVLYIEEEVYNNLKIPLKPVEYAYFESKGVTFWDKEANFIVSQLKSPARTSIKNMNHAQRMANEALGRKRGPILTERDFSGPQFKPR